MCSKFLSANELYASMAFDGFYRIVEGVNIRQNPSIWTDGAKYILIKDLTNLCQPVLKYCGLKIFKKVRFFA